MHGEMAPGRRESRMSDSVCKDPASAGFFLPVDAATGVKGQISALRPIKPLHLPQ
jgi:hypothetical protein